MIFRQNIGTQFVSFIVNVSNHSVNAQETNYVRKRISSVRSSKIKAMIQLLGLNMLVLIPSLAIIASEGMRTNIFSHIFLFLIGELP